MFCFPDKELKCKPAKALGRQRVNTGLVLAADGEHAQRAQDSAADNVCHYNNTRQHVGSQPEAKR